MISILHSLRRITELTTALEAEMEGFITLRNTLAHTEPLFDTQHNLFYLMENEAPRLLSATIILIQKHDNNSGFILKKELEEERDSSKMNRLLQKQPVQHYLQIPKTSDISKEVVISPIVNFAGTSHTIFSKPSDDVKSDDEQSNKLTQ